MESGCSRFSMLAISGVFRLATSVIAAFLISVREIRTTWVTTQQNRSATPRDRGPRRRGDDRILNTKTTSTVSAKFLARVTDAPGRRGVRGRVGGVAVGNQ